MSASGGIKTFSSLSNHLNAGSGDQTCFVDTSILFSSTYDSDVFNSESEMVFDLLAGMGFSIFTNINVRSEFLENHRRVLIPEILIDLLLEMADCVLKESGGSKLVFVPDSALR